MEEYTAQDSKAPFNMAVATLMSLRQTLDHIRNIQARIDYPPEERQRIKIELTKNFYNDSCPLLMDDKVIEKYEYILDIVPQLFLCVDKGGNQRRKIKYSEELNKSLNLSLRNLQIELQKKGYYMPPRDDMGKIGAKMS